MWYIPIQMQIIIIAITKKKDIFIIEVDHHFPPYILIISTAIRLDSCSNSPSNLLKSLEMGPAKYPKDAKVCNDYATGLGCFDSHYNSFYNSSWNKFKKGAVQVLNIQGLRFLKRAYIFCFYQKAILIVHVEALVQVSPKFNTPLAPFERLRSNARNLSHEVTAIGLEPTTTQFINEH